MYLKTTDLCTTYQGKYHITTFLLTITVAQPAMPILLGLAIVHSMYSSNAAQNAVLTNVKTSVYIFYAMQ